jgi:hypothetical protein
MHKKGGVKLAGRVIQPIGRAKQKYPSAQGRYDIELNYSEDHRIALEMNWSQNANKEKQANDNLGTYFIRTIMDIKDEVIVWNVYNWILRSKLTPYYGAN